MLSHRHGFQSVCDSDALLCNNGCLMKSASQLCKATFTTFKLHAVTCVFCNHCSKFHKLDSVCVCVCVPIIDNMTV